MVEHLSTRAVLKDKLSSVATDVMSKIDHTVQNMGKVKPTEDAPINYRVTHKGGALVRSGHDTSSAQVHQLAAGQVVCTVELVGRRARIIMPVEGWVSTETKDGVQIMRPCTMQRKAHQTEAFEHMFEQKFNRLKMQKDMPTSKPMMDSRGGGSRRDRDRSGSRDYRSYSPDSYSDDDRGDRRGGRKGGRDSSPKGNQSNDAGAFVPRLAAPGTSGGPRVLDPPPGASQSAGPSGSAPPPGASSSDLLSMDEPQASGSSAPGASGTPFDPFGNAPAAAPDLFGGGFNPATPAPAAPAVPAAQGFNPAAQTAAPTGNVGFEFDAFQSSTPGNGSAQFNPMQQQQQQQQQQMGMGSNMGAGGSGGWAGAPATGMGNAAMGQQQSQNAGWGAMQSGQGQMNQMNQGGVMGQMGNPMGNQMGSQMAGQMGQMGQMGGQMGMGAMSGMPGMANMGMGGFQQGQMGMGMGSMGQGQQQFGQQQQQFGCGGSMGGNAGFAAFHSGTAPGQMGGGMGCGGGMQLPASGASGMMLPGGGAGANVDDMMSKAMQGVANMSMEQRQSGAGPASGVPINMMQGRMM